MKNYIKLFGIIALTALIVFSAAACKGKSGSASGSAASSSGSSSTSIDSFLVDYEEFVDEYVVIMQKLMSGDMSAVDDAEKLESYVNEWAERWEKISPDDFTPAQTLKLQELNTKMSSILEL